MKASHTPAPGPSAIRGRWVWWIFAAIATYYLLSEYHARGTGFTGWLPLGLLLLCLLMHVFMHRGHGHGAHGAHRDTQHGMPPGPTPDSQPARHDHQPPEH